MDRKLILAALAIALAVYGIYMALFIPGMIVGTGNPLLLLAFGAQALFAIAAAIGVARRSGWAAGAVLLLGVAIVATQIVEGLVLGLIALNHMLLVALAGILVTIAIALYVRRGRVPA